MSPLADRLEFADDMFLRRHRGLAGPVVTQCVWRLSTAYDAELLTAFADALGRGGLTRRAEPALVPGARGRWRPGVAPAPDLDRVVLPASEAMGWLECRAAAALDPFEGVSWRLAATNVDDGGALVSLVNTHACADGAAVIDAVQRAAAGAEPVVPSDPAPAAAVLDDVVDVGRQMGAIGTWARDRLRRRPPASRAARAAPAGPGAPAAPGMPAGIDDAAVPDEPARPPGDWRTPWVVAELDTESVLDAARAQGGTPTAWFVAATARIVAAAGRAAADGSVPVALPVSGRRRDDRRANSTRIARVELDAETLARRDLGRVRALCKEAYAALAEAPPPPVPLALVQMLPDTVVRRLPQPPNARLLASNIGTLSETFVKAAGPHVRSVASGAHQVGVGAAEVAAAGAGMCAWALTAGDRTTFSIVGLDPERLADRAALAALVDAELASWGLEGSRW